MEFQSISSCYYNRGLLLVKNNDITGALSEFSKAFKFNMKNYLCCNLMGLCFYKLGEFKEAKNIWEKSVIINKLEENLALGYLNTMEEMSFKEICQKYNQALKCSHNKNYKKALVILSKYNLYKQMKEIVLFDNVYGLCNYARGNKRRAVIVWRKVLEIDSNNQQALKYLSQIYRNNDDKEGILSILKKIFTN